MIQYVIKLKPPTSPSKEFHPFDRNRRYMIQLQYNTFWLQNLCSSAIFIPTLLALFVLINFYQEWNYNANVILDNTNFNMTVYVLVAMGVLSFVLSFNITWVKCMKRFTKAISHLDDSDHKVKCVRKIKKRKHKIDASASDSFKRRRKREEQERRVVYAGETPRLSRKEFKLHVDHNQGQKNIKVKSDTDDVNGSDKCAKTLTKKSLKKNKIKKKHNNDNEPNILCTKDVEQQTRYLESKDQSNRTCHSPDRVKVGRICIGIIIVKLIVFSALIPFILHESTRPHHPYVYYKPAKNHTNIIKVSSHS